jgi:hypothetical protein
MRWTGCALLVAAIAGIATPACNWSPETTAGLNSLIGVQAGQAFRGSISDPPVANQATAYVVPRNATVSPGARGKSINGGVGPDANAVALGVAGDVAYWRVPALSEDQANPGHFVFTATLSVARDIVDSPLLQSTTEGLTLPLSARAIQYDGTFGPERVQPFLLDMAALSGNLAISLQWDTATDLDLHVVIPDGKGGQSEVWAKARSADPATVDGNLDFDSNANCAIDGRDQENVVWQGAPAVGHYIVRVAAASLCGQTSAPWWAYASVPGVLKGEASGVLTPSALRSGSAAGSGVTAFEFDYP